VGVRGRGNVAGMWGRRVVICLARLRRPFVYTCMSSCMCVCVQVYLSAIFGQLLCVCVCLEMGVFEVMTSKPAVAKNFLTKPLS